MAMFNNNYNSGSSQFSGSQIGGGFIQNENFNSSNNNNFNNKPSYSQNGGSGGGSAVVPYDQRKLSQITIKQIKTAPAPQPDENLVVDNQEISQTQMIAQIRSINIQSSHTTLTVNDYTGTLDAKQWHNDNQDDDVANLREGTWVRIFGRINMFHGKASINVFQIFPITDFNEITHHFIECIYSHLENTKPTNNKQQQQQQQMMMNDNNQNMNNQNNQNQWNQQNNNNYSNNNNNNNMNNNMNNNGLPLIQNMILNIINTPEFENSETGCNVEVLFQRMPNENVNNIRNGIDELANAGHLYSTVDDDHYKYSGDQN